MAQGHVPIRRHTISQVEAYDVTPEELDSIERECTHIGLDFHVALFFLTLAITLHVALETTDIKYDRTFQVFVMLVIVGYSLGAIFGMRWFWNRGSLAIIFRRIRGRQIGPTGDASHELQASQVAALQPVTVPQKDLEEVARQAAELLEQDKPMTTKEVMNDLRERGEAMREGEK